MMVGAAVRIREFLHLSSCRRQRFFLGTDNAGLAEDKVSSMLGLGRGGEDCPAVALEDLQPVVDVLRMAHVLERDAGLRGGRGKLDKLLSGKSATRNALRWA